MLLILFRKSLVRVQQSAVAAPVWGCMTATSQQSVAWQAAWWLTIGFISSHLWDWRWHAQHQKPLTSYWPAWMLLMVVLIIVHHIIKHINRPLFSNNCYSPATFNHRHEAGNGGSAASSWDVLQQTTGVHDGLTLSSVEWLIMDDGQWWLMMVHY